MKCPRYAPPNARPKSALNEALAQQIATSEILCVIRGSLSEHQPVPAPSPGPRAVSVTRSTRQSHDGPLSASVDQQLPLNRRRPNSYPRGRLCGAMSRRRRTPVAGGDRGPWGTKRPSS